MHEGKQLLDDDADDSKAWQSVLFGVNGVLAASFLPDAIPASAATFTVGHALVLPNVVDPEAWFRSSGSWGELKNAYDRMHGDLESRIAETKSRWQDSAANEFNGFVTGELQPILKRLSETCALMDSACFQMGAGVAGVIASYLVAAASAAVAAMAANASGPASPAVKMAIFAAWAAFVAGLIGLFVSFVAVLWSTSKTVSDAYDALANKLGEKDGQIDAGSLTLPEPVRIAISKPQEWEKQQ
ncbi:hypothetical protein AB0L34_02475 [Micromonospora sp. NPDC052213]|uniref:hypothetical protein n=1 Tax=Micromonospora sp. NPDC052213 TaxID=3155812 RepID=UPI0034185EBE